jgi:hypothetical protein
MSSGPQPAVLIFPTGTGIDTYYTKVDRGDVITSEPHTIPLTGSPTYHQFYLGHIPQSGTLTIPPYTEVSSSPVGLQYSTTYAGTNAGLVQFDFTNAGVVVSATYTANGDVINAEWFNSLQSSTVAIEDFIVSGLGIIGNYVPVTGSTITGPITMNGANILTAASGGNQVGTTADPFAQIHSNQFVGQTLRNEASTESISFTGSVAISSSTDISLSSASITETASSNISLNAGADVNIVADNTNVIGHVKPTVSALYNLGSSGNRWNTVFAVNIDAPGFSGLYVSKLGDTMSGDLNMESGSTITVDNIENNSGILSIDSSSALTLNGNSVSVNSINGIAITPGIFTNVDIAGSLSVGVSSVGVSNVITPTASGIDIGTTGIYFGTVYADNFVGGALSGNFVAKAGDSMSGDLTMGDPASLGTQPTVLVENIQSLVPSGTLNITGGELAVWGTNNIHFDIGPTGNQVLQLGLANIYFSKDVMPTESGVYNLGGVNNYIDTVYANNIKAISIASGVILNNPILGDITVTGNMSFGSGVTIGSSGNPVSTIYASTIITAGSTGTFVQKAGDTMAGNLLTNASGANSIGSLAVPFGSIYADNINSTGLNGKYVLKTGDTMTGALTISTIQSTGSLVVSGLNNLNVYFNQTAWTAEQHNITSTVGDIIIDATTELQQLVNGAAKIVVNPSGTELYDNIYPDGSGLYTVGRPDRPFAAIYANSIINTNISGTGVYVLKAGDGMFGDLTMIGADVLTSVSGANTVGSSGLPFLAVYADNFFMSGSAFGSQYVLKAGDTMTGDLNLNGGNRSIASLGGNLTIQAPLPTETILVQAYDDLTLQSSTTDVNVTAASGVYLNAGLGGITIGGGTNLVYATAGGGILSIQNSEVYLAGNSGELVSLTGSTVRISQGTLNYAASNTQNVFYKDIVPSGSGTVSVGTIAIPFGDLFVQNINGFDASRQVYNEIPSGNISSGTNALFYTIYNAISGTERLYKGGLRMSPGNDYTMAGSGITFSGSSIPTSGTNLLIDYERLIF